ncbi:hypothetical protein J2S16_003227 [Cytobacillus kochii]|nr:hypothetical protein [Cytobacillus kochii]
MKFFLEILISLLVVAATEFMQFLFLIKSKLVAYFV